MFRKVNGRSLISFHPCNSAISVTFTSAFRLQGTNTDMTAKERPIGFYHSGPRLRSSDLEITDLFRRFCDRPVMVIVDTRSSGGRGETGIPTDAYFAVEEIRDVRFPSLLSGRTGRNASSGRIPLYQTCWMHIYGKQQIRRKSVRIRPAPTFSFPTDTCH